VSTVRSRSVVTSTPRPRSHPAGLVEDGWNKVLGAALGRRGWRAKVIPYQGYGSRETLRVLARVLLVPGGEPLDQPVGPPGAEPDQAHHPEPDHRGWRSFFTLPAVGVEVVATVPAPGAAEPVEHLVRADRAGIIDVRLPNPGLPPGWHRISLRVGERGPVSVPVFVVPAQETLGLVSDIDDTVIRTLLPRPLIAAYNTFVVREQTRRPVPGMATLYHWLLSEHPNAPTVYISTGAWNTAGTLRRFLARHGYPPGPMLLTDWGPTNTGWFRSGQDHKRACLRALAADLPSVRWVLIGDDGQHDPSLYDEFAREHPEAVRAIAIRQLTPTEQVLAHGTAVNRLGEGREAARGEVPEVRGPDGDALRRALTGLDLT
jgi:phosphatidate phosphatase APP1